MSGVGCSALLAALPGLFCLPLYCFKDLTVIYWIRSSIFWSICFPENQIPNTAVTFGSEHSFLLSQPWKSGSLSISFRTHHDKALILYQTGTSKNINYFVVAFTSGNIFFMVTLFSYKITCEKQRKGRVRNSICLDGMKLYWLINALMVFKVWMMATLWPLFKNCIPVYNRGCF